MSTTTLYVPDEIVQKFQILAEKSGKSTADCMHEALLEHLENIEDAQNAMQTLSRIRSGKEKTYTLEEVEECL